jgi:RNA polymerase sigma-70 factor (ECF subfamily)
MIAPDSSGAVRFLPVTDRRSVPTPSQREARYDAGLVRRFNSGDATAFLEIVTRYRTKMLHVALPLLRNHADAEEIAQDTFVRAHRGLASFRGESSLAAWLHRIALNLSRNRYWYFNRRQRHRGVPFDEVLGADNSSTLAEMIASPEPGPVQAAVLRDFSTLVASSMALLSPGQREILLLRNGGDHSYRDIARQLDIEIGTVKSRIARARERLRFLLEEAYASSPHPASSSPWFESHRATGLIGTVENKTGP